MGLLNSGVLGMLPMLMQQQGAKKPDEGAMQAPLFNMPKPMAQFANGLSSQGFQNGLQMMQTGEAPQFGGMQGAFSNNPQFQQHLGNVMNGQGPGRQAPTFTPPPMPMGMGGVGQQGSPRGMTGNPLDNFGMSMGDPMQYFMSRLGRPGS